MHTRHQACQSLEVFDPVTNASLRKENKSGNWSLDTQGLHSAQVAYSLLFAGCGGARIEFFTIKILIPCSEPFQPEGLSCWLWALD